MNKYVTATWISVRTYGCEAGKSGFRDVKEQILSGIGENPIKQYGLSEAFC